MNYRSIRNEIMNFSSLLHVSWNWTFFRTMQSEEQNWNFYWKTSRILRFIIYAILCITNEWNDHKILWHFSFVVQKSEAKKRKKKFSHTKGEQIYGSAMSAELRWCLEWFGLVSFSHILKLSSWKRDEMSAAAAQ